MLSRFRYQPSSPPGAKEGFNNLLNFPSPPPSRPMTVGSVIQHRLASVDRSVDQPRPRMIVNGSLVPPALSLHIWPPISFTDAHLQDPVSRRVQGD